MPISKQVEKDLDEVFEGDHDYLSKEANPNAGDKEESSSIKYSGEIEPGKKIQVEVTNNTVRITTLPSDCSRPKLEILAKKMLDAYQKFQPSPKNFKASGMNQAFVNVLIKAAKARGLKNVEDLANEKSSSSAPPVNNPPATPSV